MQRFPFLMTEHHFRIGLRALLAGLIASIVRRDDLRDLSTYLLRDIGLSEPGTPDWDRLLK